MVVVVAGAHAFNASTQEADRGRRIAEFKASLVCRERVVGQPGLHREILFQKAKQNKNKKQTESNIPLYGYAEVYLSTTSTHLGCWAFDQSVCHMHAWCLRRWRASV